MVSHKIFSDVLTNSQIQYINGLAEVAEARGRIENGARVAYFSVQLNDSIKATLRERLGLDLSTVNQVPMRWIRGDTMPHVDVAQSTFDNTYLLYMNDSPGELILESESYPIMANTAFVFNEGLRHETLHTGSAPRLLLGPMNELAQPVGSSGVYYYPSQMDAILQTNLLYSGNYTIQSVLGITHWRIAIVSGSAPPSPLFIQQDKHLLVMVPIFFTFFTRLRHVS
jgi:hypothetical protein